MIDWTEQAIGQLDQAFDYITLANGNDVAARIVTRTLRTVQRLEAFPMSGRAGRVQGTRELVITNMPFVTAYTVDKARIVVLALYRGAQRWPEEF